MPNIPTGAARPDVSPPPPPCGFPPEYYHCLSAGICSSPSGMHRHSVSCLRVLYSRCRAMCHNSYIHPPCLLLGLFGVPAERSTLLLSIVPYYGVSRHSASRIPAGYTRMLCVHTFAFFHIFHIFDAGHMFRCSPHVSLHAPIYRCVYISVYMSYTHTKLIPHICMPHTHVCTQQTVWARSIIVCSLNMYICVCLYMSIYPRIYIYIHILHILGTGHPYT